MTNTIALLAGAVVWSMLALANSKVNRLMLAVQRGDTPLIAQLIDQIPIDSRDPKARTAVHNAVIHMQPNTLKLLLAKGADKNLLDVDGNTPLDLWQHYQDDFVRGILLDAKALTGKEVAKQMDTEMLFKAAEDGDRKAVEFLLAADADPKAKNAAGQFPFHLAAANKHFSVAAILLKAVGDASGMNGVNRGDDKSWLPINWAVLGRDWELVRQFLRAGAEFKYRSYTSYRPRQDVYDIAALTHQENRLVAEVFAAENKSMILGLMEKASRQGNFELYQKLLDNGFDLGDEETADAAASKALSFSDLQARDTVDFILANGINKHSLAKKLGSSSILSNTTVMAKVLAYGVDPNVYDASGNTALISAIRRTDIPIDSVRQLLAAGADPNLVDSNGYEPLIQAVKSVTSYTYYRINSRNFKYLQMLLEAGADPNALEGKDTKLNQRSALDLLTEAIQKSEENHLRNNGRSDILRDNIAAMRKMVALLIEYGATPASPVPAE